MLHPEIGRMVCICIFRFFFSRASAIFSYRLAQYLKEPLQTFPPSKILSILAYVRLGSGENNSVSIRVSRIDALQSC